MNLNCYLPLHENSYWTVFRLEHSIEVEELPAKFVGERRAHVRLAATTHACDEYAPL
jgi:hypothetical protein